MFIPPPSRETSFDLTVLFFSVELSIFRPIPPSKLYSTVLFSIVYPVPTKFVKFNDLIPLSFSPKVMRLFVMKIPD